MKVITLLLCCLLCGINSVFSQPIGLEAQLDTVSEEGKAALLNQISWDIRNVDASLSKDYGLMAVDQAKKMEDPYQLMRAYSFTGVAFRNMGYYEEALNYYSKGLDLALELKNQEQQCYGYINIANLYIYLNNPKEAEIHLKKVKPTIERIDKANISGYYYLNVGRIHLEFGRFEEALANINRSLDIRIKSENVTGQSVCKKYIGDVYLKMLDYRLAESNYKQSLRIMKQENDRDLHAAALNGLANAQLGYKDLSSAAANAKKSLRISNQVSSLLRAKKANETLAAIAKQKGALLDMDQYLQEVIRIKDQLYTEDLQKQTERFAFTLQNRELSYEKEMQRLQFAADKKRILIVGISISAMLVILIAGGAWAYVSHRKATLQRRHLEMVQKQNSLLEEKVATRTQELKEKNESLEKLSMYKEELTQMIAHDLKNPLNTVIVLSEKGNSEQMQYISHAGNSMLEMVNNMLDVHKFEEAGMVLARENHTISHLLEEARQQVLVLLQAKSITLQFVIDTSISIHVDKELFTRVFTNLLTNAIKYSIAGQTITLLTKADESTKEITISVVDEGIGISNEFLPYVFDKYRQAAAKKSGKSGATGLGLAFCKLAVEAHGGAISVVSAPGLGSTFNITLPWETVTTYDQGHGLSRVSEEQDLVQLSNEEVVLLQPIIPRLADIPLYEASTINEVLLEVTAQSNGLDKWKRAVIAAAYHWDENKYKGLLGVVQVVKS